MLFWVFLLLLLIALVIATVPVWPYSRRWGYVPTGVAVGIVLVFLLLTYIGYIGPWTQPGPPYLVEEGPDGGGGPAPPGVDETVAD